VGHGSTVTTPALNANVTALNTDNPGVLYVGGNFTNAGGQANADRIAKWSGTAWSAIGGTPLTNGQVFAIAYDAVTHRIFAGGTFLDAGGNANADHLAVWNGSTWAPFCNPATPGAAFEGNVEALQIIGNTLLVGGSFQNGARIPEADYLVACDLTSGNSSATVAHSLDISGAVLALTADSNGTLYAGGNFHVVGIPLTDRVAYYSGGAWHPMGGTLPNDPAVHGIVRSLTAAGTDVYVGTDAIDVEHIDQADHIARWNATTLSWSAVGSNNATTDGWFSTATAYTIDALDTYGSILVAAGSFQNANGIATADGVAYFDGSHWRPIGSDGTGNGPFSSAHPTAVGITHSKVYVGGNMTSAGGDTLAKYLTAYAMYQPDALIGATSTGSFVGNNTYNATGYGEVRSVTVTRGHSVTSYVKIQNDGLDTIDFAVTTLGSATGITARYYRGTTEITAGLRNGTYTTPFIAARGSILIRLEVHVARSSASKATIRTTVRSQAGTPPDAVRLVVKATG
jgi:trimeric autotransporter adhesin